MWAERKADRRKEPRAPTYKKPAKIGGGAHADKSAGSEMASHSKTESPLLNRTDIASHHKADSPAQNSADVSAHNKARTPVQSKSDVASVSSSSKEDASERHKAEAAHAKSAGTNERGHPLDVDAGLCVCVCLPCLTHICSAKPCV
jgi:hypothetical protein